VTLHEEIGVELMMHLPALNWYPGIHERQMFLSEHERHSELQFSHWLVNLLRNWPDEQVGKGWLLKHRLFLES
jgi:hypothetical protein